MMAGRVTRLVISQLGKRITILAGAGKEDTMRLNSLRSVVSGAVLLLVFSVLLGASAQAQDRDYRNNGYGQYGYQGQWTRDRTRDYAYKLGYHTGYSEVRDANENGYRRSLRDIPGYRNDTNGYLEVMRYRDDYRSAYRRGFAAA